jgi:hypothetical protein
MMKRNEEASILWQLKEQCSWSESRIAIQAALILGFQSEAAQFPVIQASGAKPLPTTMAAFNDLVANSSLETANTEKKIQGEPRPAFDWRVEKGLESLFAPGTFLLDRDLDFLPDQINFKMVLPADAPSELVQAACNLAYRFGMETLGLAGWLLEKEPTSGNVIQFKVANKCRLYQETTATGTILHVEGHGAAITEFVSLICERFPDLSPFETWATYLQKLIAGFAGKNLDGELAVIKARGVEQLDSAFVDSAITYRQAQLPEALQAANLLSHKALATAYEKEYDVPWEVDTLNELLDTQVYPHLKSGDEVELLATVSEEPAERTALTVAIGEKVQALTGKAGTVRVLSSYKQGFSWLAEVVVPQLKHEAVEHVQIAFKPFLKAGQTDWLDEDGAVPSYTNLEASDANKWYDLPIRFLQELYPIRDVFEKELQLQPAQIEFVAYEGSADLTYQVIATNAREQTVLSTTYLAKVSERPYLDAFPKMGLVHPNTNQLHVKVNGQIVCNQAFATDLEQIWQLYQQAVLPDVITYLETTRAGKLLADSQPFFAQLKLEITASEPDYQLASRNDLMSSLDAFHEDLYFVGADYFKNVGFSQTGTPFEEPGLILPLIKKTPGKRPTFKVTLAKQLSEHPRLQFKNGSIYQAPARTEVQASIHSLTYDLGKLVAEIKITGVASEVVAAYGQLLTDAAVDERFDFSAFSKLIFNVEGKYYNCYPPNQVENEKNLAPQDFMPIETAVYGYDQYLDAIAQLKKIKGLAVYPVATSYLGRTIYAVELLPTLAGYVSRTKRLNNYPSEIINCRHHANEVASTNAAFMLIKELLTDERYDNLAAALNLVIVPMENVDGSALHYELQQENPEWKLHVARFNAVGKEFYREHFKVETKHTEAYGFTRLYAKFLPDVVVDNHGVPTHEWEQPFSGYTSPSYKGFWLPRSLLYGYFWYVNNPEYAGNVALNKKMEQVVAEAMAQHAEIRQWNQEWIAQFETYAHQWLPKLFPANYYRDMINYWIPFAADENHRYPSIKFPWITSIAYTSEVADETAQGDYLALCAKAHVTHDLATIDWLCTSQSAYEARKDVSASHFTVTQKRIRPLKVAPVSGQ